AYSVFSTSQSFSDTGLFTIYTGTAPEEVRKLMPVLCAEIRKAADTISADETKRAKAQLKSGLLMSLESPSNRCSQRARQLAIYGQPLSTAEMIARVEAIDTASIRAAAARIFTGVPTLAAIGPLQALVPLSEITSQIQ
ncbi:MAG: insulinase family protein, partial [Rhodospirillaceae bacterium]|nr:insulinase family protein [Rhodospirillaceae bacterium]